MKCRICGEEFEQPSCQESDLAKWDVTSSICQSCNDFLHESVIEGLKELQQ